MCSKRRPEPLGVTCLQIPQSLNSAITKSSRLDQKFPIAHDLLLIDPDVELASDDINVSGRVPLRAGVRAVRISERDVNSGIFLVLQNLANDILQVNIGPDREFANPVAVFVRMCVLPEIGFQ